MAVNLRVRSKMSKSEEKIDNFDTMLEKDVPPKVR
jgi:hypothetical protein